MYSYIISIDQGTHSTRAIIYDKHGAAIFQAKKSIQLNYLDDYKVEQDGSEIAESCRFVLRQAHQYIIKHQLEDVAVAISTQRSTVIAWNVSTGKVLSPALSWLDTRAQHALEQLNLNATEIKTKTGLPVSPHYGASKLQWLLENNKDVQHAEKQNKLMLGPLAAFLVFNLVKQNPAYVDYSNAHRTLLWNLHTQEWDDSILKSFAIDATFLPKPVPNAFSYGEVNEFNYPLVLLNGDQNSSVYGHANTETNVAYINIGTGGFVIARCQQLPSNETKLLASTTFSTESECEYALEGTINGAGASMSWAKEQWGMENILDITWSDVKEVPIFINSVGGLGSPWWESDIEEKFIQEGKTHVSYTQQQCKAALMESIVFLIYKNLQEMHRYNIEPASLVVSGGMSADQYMCQRIADISGIPVMVSSYKETTSRGAAWLAMGKPIWKLEQTITFEPQTDSTLQNRYQKFVSELQRLIN